MTAKKVKIKFLKTRVVDNNHKNTAQETKFLEGKTYSLSSDSAAHWVKRGFAEYVVDKKTVNKGSDNPGSDNPGDGNPGDGTPGDGNPGQ